MASYIDKALAPGEVVVLRTKKSVYSYWMHATALVIAALYIVAIFGLLSVAWKVVVLIGYFAVAATLALDAWLEIWSTEIAITNRRIILKTGVISRKTDEQRLEKIDSVTFDQSILGRVLGYGTVLTRGSGVSFTPLKGIDAPMHFAKSAQEAINALHQPAGR